MNKKKGNKSLISLMNMSHAISVTSCVIFTHTFNYCVSFLYLSLSLARDIFCLIVYIWYLIVHLLANFLLAICICAQCAHTHVHTLIQYFIVYNTMPKKIVNEFSKFAFIRLFLFDLIWFYKNISTTIRSLTDQRFLWWLFPCKNDLMNK